MTYPYCRQVYRVGDFGFKATDEYLLMKELEEYYSSKGAAPTIECVADGVLVTIDGYLGDAYMAAQAKIRELDKCARDDYSSRKKSSRRRWRSILWNKSPTDFSPWST